MSSAVCTIFEGHYHYGVAALSNSLYIHGYRGDIYAGYRGQLPFWASSALNNSAIGWSGCKSMEIITGLWIHFLPITVDSHLAHHKPDFMLQLLEGPAKGNNGIVYFDPDIVIRCKWGFYEKWITYGVALVHEVVSNDMPPTHPSRKEWEKVIEFYKKGVVNKLYSYLNCGFCGVEQKYIEFLKVWSDIIKIAVREYGLDPAEFASFDRTNVFWSIDQDAFNIAAMCCSSPLSEIGSEGMDFVEAGWTMSHATGTPKPWKKIFLMSFLDGKPPSRAEKAFWMYVDGPVKMFNPIYINYKRISLTVASFLGRFYRRY